MRLKSEIWVSAYCRRVMATGTQVVVARHGDDDAGSIFICVRTLDGRAMVFGPAPMGLSDANTDRRWVKHHETADVAETWADEHLATERRLDPDAWVIDVEDRAGRHFLDDAFREEGDAKNTTDAEHFFR